MCTEEIIINSITIIVALISLVYSIYSGNKVNKINLRVNYYDIFKEDLTKIIPEYYTKFMTDESMKCNDKIGKEFESYINEFRTKIKFLMFVDEKQYQNLDNELISLEEEIILLPTKKEQKLISQHIRKMEYSIKKIYKILNKHFS